MIYKAKPLPRDSDGNILRTWKANGRTYTILTYKEAFVPIRQSWLEKLSFEWIFGGDLTKVSAQIKQLAVDLYEKGQDPEGLFDIGETLNAMYRGLLTRSKQKYSVSLVIATLFIVRDNEKLSSWTLESAKEKINDWNTEEITADDFFLLSKQLLKPITKQSTKNIASTSPELLRRVLGVTEENSGTKQIEENFDDQSRESTFGTKSTTTDENQSDS